VEKLLLSQEKVLQDKHDELNGGGSIVPLVLHHFNVAKHSIVSQKSSDTFRGGGKKM